MATGVTSGCKFFRFGGIGRHLRCLPGTVCAGASPIATLRRAFSANCAGLFLAALALGVFASPGAAQTTGYAIAPGDTLSIYMSGELSLGQPQVVGADGTVPVQYVGYVPIAGLDVTTAQERIGNDLVSRGLYATADVLVVIDSYRPIFVSGDVNRPGTYSFMPGMTVARAVALAGGPRSFTTGGEISPVAMQQHLNAVGALDGERRAFLRAHLAVQSLEARLAGAEAPGLVFEEATGLDPQVVAEAIDEESARFALQTRIAADQRALIAERLALIDAEIETVTARRDELARLVDILTEDLARAQVLVGRGAQVQSAERELRFQEAIAQSQRNLSLARVDMLEMDRALSLARQRRAEAEAARTGFDRELALALSQERQRQVDAAAAARARSRTLEAQIALFPGLPGTLGTEEAAPAFRYVIEHDTQAAPTSSRVDADHAVAPGDLILVEIISYENGD